MRIAVVDDDEEALEFVSMLLTQQGHTCVTFRRSQDVPVALRRDTFDLLVLDWNMPALTGMEIMAWARATLPACPPVIILTSRADKDDISDALNAGADDYIVKPESGSVIVARVNAVLRRTSAGHATERVSHFGIYRFDQAKELVYVGDQQITLTAKEFHLAWVFFSNVDRPLSRAWLLEMVWNSVAELSTRTLDMHVSRIRTKLQLRAEFGYRLQSVFGFGYRLESI